jgi:hypothetical protein
MANRRKVMTWECLRALIESGAGQGHGNDYQPFLQVTGARSSPSSNLGRKFLPGRSRVMHTLSQNEWTVALLLTFLGAEDVREQFPLWPMPHPHPLFGHQEFESLGLQPARGTLAIAQDANIVHGNFLGSDIPNVLTIDLLATFRARGKLSVSLVSCKPRQLLEAQRPSDRMPARLQLEKLYADEIGAHLALCDQRILSKVFQTNLHRFSPSRATLLEFQNQDDLVQQVEGNVKSAISDLPKRELEQRLARDLNISGDMARRAISLLAWLQRIDIDFSKTPTESLPYPTGGAKINQELKRQLLGVA